MFANLYSIMKDPGLFPNPDVFNPERFLDTSHPRLKDFDLPFGFGRRACPGIHLARNSTFIAAARLIWAFDISPAVGSQGEQIMPDPDQTTDSSAVRPVEFDCCLVPRDGRTVTTVLADWEYAKGQLDNW